MSERARHFEHAPFVEGSSVVSTSVESFSTLWAGKNIQPRPLVLPDQLRPKFYLPVSIRVGFAVEYYMFSTMFKDKFAKQIRKEKLLERDRKRIDFLCQRDASQHYSENSVTIEAKRLLDAGSQLEQGPRREKYVFEMRNDYLLNCYDSVKL
jgi:hypothetical protein